MAQESPNSLDVQEIQFKLHDKFSLFPVSSQLRSHVNLLTAASSKGLLFAGSPNAAEIKVALLKDLVDVKSAGRKLLVRSVPLPSIPNVIACSADGCMLAVNCTLNGSGFLQIFSVPSFTTPNIKTISNIRLSAEENVYALQLLWNPVITNSIAVVLSNGALSVYTLKDGGQYEMHSMDKSQQVKCGCWSPKGKQIVLGFPQGKLQQFKPDLSPAKTIVCPTGVHPGPFDTIALHWLSTFQFAVVFLQHGDMSPSLYIVNAPKGGTPSYINYYDICYSGHGPRAQQFSFTHIQQWNLLLVTSANGVEVGILGTKESGETPTWLQYTLLDEARIEMPLTESKEETYPIGFAFDTASSHRLIIGEQEMPVMPMVHMLSTQGHLVCFNFLNLTSGAADVCSPPPPLQDTSEQFQPIQEQKTTSVAVAPAAALSSAQGSSDMSFAFAPNAGTSTPTVKDKAAPLFGNTSAAPANSSMLAQSTTFAAAPGAGMPVSSFGLSANGASNTPQFGALSAPPNGGASGFAALGGLTVGNTPSFGGFSAAKPVSFMPASSNIVAQQQQQHHQQQVTTSSAQKVSNELSKPLYMVPPTYTPAAAAEVGTQKPKSHTGPAAVNTQMNTCEVDEVVKQLIAVQINSFDMELKQLANQSKHLLGNIGNPAEMKGCTKRLNDLQEIIEQADDRDFELDVQQLRHALDESYAMLAECRSKLDMYNNPDITRLTSISTFDPINRRQLAKLQSYLATNQAQMQQLQQQIDEQWSGYQDLVRRNSKTQMHIPCLDGIYQRMTKLKDVVARQRIKLNYIKTKLKQKGLLYKPLNEVDASATNANTKNTMESLADSVLSMSLSHVVDVNRSKLSVEKLNAIRQFARQQQQITIIKPQRPDRVGLKSEFILESKLRSDRKAREGAATNITKMQQEKLQPKPATAAAAESSSTHSQMQLAKPTATKPFVAPIQPQTSFAPPAQVQTATSSFNFAGTGTSPFVKTSASAGKADESGVQKTFETPAGGSSSFATPIFTGFGSTTMSTSLGFGHQPAKVTISKPESLKEALSAPPIQTPISFSAKVIGGDAAKSTAVVSTSLPNSTSAGVVSSGFAALTANTAIATPPSLVKPSIQQVTQEKKAEDAPKAFSFAATSEGTAAPTFGGFGVASTAKSSSALFDGKSSGIANSSNFSFGGIGASLGAAIPQSNTVAAAATSSAVPSAFSFGGSPAIASTAVNSMAPAVTSTGKPPLFSGFGKSVGDAAPSVVISSAVASNPNSTNTNEVSSTAAPTITSKSSVSVSMSNMTGPAAVPTSSNLTITSDLTDSLFGTLSVCKPLPREGDATTTANAFSGFGGSNAFSFAAAADTEYTKSIFSTNNASSNFATLGSPLGSSNSNDGATTTGATSTTTSSTTTPASSAPVSVFGGNATAATGVTSTQPATTSIFGVGSATASAAATTISTPTPTTATSSIFGGTAAFVTPPAATTQSDTNNTTSIFGAAAPNSSVAPTVATTTSSIFGAVSNTSASSTTTTSAAPASGNIFGGIPKPDQSVFASVAPTSPTAVGAGLFAAAAAANPLPFGSPTAVSSGGSIFGGGGNTGASFGAAAAATTGGGSIFGGGGASSPVTSPFGSLFGGAAKPSEGGSIFGSPTQPQQQQPPIAAGGGSIFGQSTFGQTGQSSGNLFGAATQQQQPATTGFGSSIFGGASTNTTAISGGSIFGGGSATSAPAFGASSPSTGFGAFSQSAAAPGFGVPNPGGTFGQATGASVAQSGFGSPQQTSAFAKPVFGGVATFGSPPAFGAQPSFGGAANFGSPKSFGSFTAPGATTSPNPGAFGSPTQKNNLFEALGATDSGLSFGNLAQTTNANAQKPSFGGSSFMNYRA